jgi:hypothetical protein
VLKDVNTKNVDRVLSFPDAFIIMMIEMKKFLLLLGGLIILAAVPVTIFVVKQNQDLRSRAAPNTTLTFNPAAITRQVGDEFNLEVVLDPGKNEVFYATLLVSYDPTKLDAETIVNGPIFPNVVRPGTIDAAGGKISITVGAANQTSPVISPGGTAAIIKFKAMAASQGPLSVRFVNPDTFVGASQEGSSNVLLSSQPASVTITQSGNSTASISVTPTLIPTSGILPSPTPILPVTVTPTGASLFNTSPTPTTGISPTATLYPTPTLPAVVNQSTASAIPVTGSVSSFMIMAIVSGVALIITGVFLPLFSI